MPKNLSNSHFPTPVAPPYRILFPQTESSRQAAPNSVCQSLVRIERIHKAVVSRRGPLVIRADSRRVAEDQVRNHAPKDNTAVVVEVRPVVRGEVVLLRGLIADGVDERERRLVQVDIWRRRRLGRGDGSQALVVQRVGCVVLGCEDAPCEGRCEELRGFC